MEIKEEINLEDIFNKIKINLRIVIVLPLTVTVLTAIYSLSIPNTFKATVKYSVEDQFFSSLSFVFFILITTHIFSIKLKYIK